MHKIVIIYYHNNDNHDDDRNHAHDAVGCDHRLLYNIHDDDSSSELHRK